MLCSKLKKKEKQEKRQDTSCAITLYDKRESNPKSLGDELKRISVYHATDVPTRCYRNCSNSNFCPHYVWRWNDRT